MTEQKSFTHFIKVTQKDFDEITSGKKSFILTKDTDYLVGDRLAIQMLRDEQQYTVSLVENDVMGISKGWAIISFVKTDV